MKENCEGPMASTVADVLFYFFKRHFVSHLAEIGGTMSSLVTHRTFLEHASCTWHGSKDTESVMINISANSG